MDQKGQEAAASGGASIADWPEFFMDELADVRGKNLDWFAAAKNAENAAPRSTKAKSQRERNERRKAKQRASASSEEISGRESKPAAVVEPTHIDELYIWLIDAYRMRCHDDLQWRGGIRRGVYEQMVRVERRLCRLDEGGVLSKETLSDLERITVNGVRFVVERDSGATPTAFPTSLSVAQDFSFTASWSSSVRSIHLSLISESCSR